MFRSAQHDKIEPAAEFFPALAALTLVRHAFLGRIAGIDVTTERDEALKRLDAAHRRARQQLGLMGSAFATAEQMHGDRVAVIDEPLQDDRCFAGADALLT